MNYKRSITEFEITPRLDLSSISFMFWQHVETLQNRKWRKIHEDNRGDLAIVPYVLDRSNNLRLIVIAPSYVYPASTPPWSLSI